jgi:DNA-binding transcriptional MocR family regulator
MHMLYALTALRDSKQQAADQISPVETKCEPSDNSYDRFWSESAKSRTPSYIRTLQKYLKDPEVISFGGGLPNPSTFPFESASFKLKSGDKISFNMEEMQQVLQYGASVRTIHQCVH